MEDGLSDLRLHLNVILDMSDLDQYQGLVRSLEIGMAKQQYAIKVIKMTDYFSCKNKTFAHLFFDLRYYVKDNDLQLSYHHDNVIWQLLQFTDLF